MHHFQLNENKIEKVILQNAMKTNKQQKFSTFSFDW